MPSKNELMGKEVWPASTTSSTNANAVVTVTSPTPSDVSTLYICGIILSASGTIAAAVEATLTGVMGSAGTGVTLPIEIPASATAPVVLLFGVHPLRIVPGTNAVLTLPALGSGIIGTATLLCYRGAI